MVSQPSRLATAILLVLAVAFIALMTLRPSTGTPPLPFGCIVCGALGGVDFLLNILLFAPFGLALFWLLGSWRTIMAGMAFTLLIEILQWKFIPGRDASFGDLIANTLGTAVGVMVAMVAATGLYATGRLARSLAAAFAVFASVVIVLTGWLLQPVGVRYALAVQWKASRPHLDDFQGDIQFTAFNGMQIFPFQWVDYGQFIDPRTGGVALRSTITGRIEPTVRQSIIVQLANRWEEGIYLGQWKDAAVVRSHQVAEKVRFRSLLVGLGGAFAAGNGSGLITIDARSDRRTTTLIREAGPDSIAVIVRRTVGLGWTLILPWDVAVTPRWWPANAAWLGILLLPVGFFTTRSGRHRSAPGLLVWWPLLLTLGALLATPRLFGASPPGVADWVGVAAGIIAGGVLQKLMPTHMPAPLNPLAASGTIQS